MCVVASGYNLVMTEKYTKFFKSLSTQNYTNFQVFHIDDNSEDETTLRLYAEVADKYPNLKGKVHFLRNKNNVGAFCNKDSGIKENCPKGSVVLDIDADDSLLSRQVMKVLNIVYQKSSPWVVYTNMIKQKSDKIFEQGKAKVL